jgi:hypothetical protein
MGMTDNAHVKWYPERCIQQVHDAAMAELEREGEYIIAEAVPITPIEWSTLRRSATVSRAQVGDTVWVSFNTPYALMQHEGDFNHPQGGQRKYLETPFLARVVGLKERIERAIRGAL